MLQLNFIAKWRVDGLIQESECVFVNMYELDVLCECMYFDRKGNSKDKNVNLQKNYLEYLNYCSCLY